MKRTLVGVLLLALCLGLPACGTTSAGEGFGQALEEWQGNESEPEALDIETYTDSDFSADLGFSVVSVPGGALVSPVKFFAVDGWFGQIEFHTPKGEVLVLRIATDSDPKLETTYVENHGQSDETRSVNGTEVRTRIGEKGCCMITWQQDNFQYLLHSNVAQGRPADNVVDAIVTGTHSRLAA